MLGGNKHMGSKYIISADIGTTYVKTGLYDTGGICICTLQEKVPQKYVDNGALEQNGDDFVSLFLKTVKSLI